MEIMSIANIIKLLQEQADLRSPENDEAGVLREAARTIDAETCPEDGDEESCDMWCTRDKNRLCPDDETCCQITDPKSQEG